MGHEYVRDDDNVRTEIIHFVETEGFSVEEINFDGLVADIWSNIAVLDDPDALRELITRHET